MPPLSSSPLSPDSEGLFNPTRRVNVPHFDGDIRFSETVIFWFGKVDPVTNYADVRVGYTDDLLYVHLVIFDRRLWYDPYPSAGELTAWDAATLYLEMNGNTGSVPTASTYRFDAQLVSWEEPRDNWQVAYQGDGSGWMPASLPFTTESGWRGDVPNDDVDDRGWRLTFEIPFASLGQASPPPEGTVWGLALALHDRDDEQGTPISDQIWPEAMDPQQPVTWGQLAFGLPSYQPPESAPGETVVLRHGLDQAVVVDADVGGSSVCGDPAAPDYFPTWGSLNYAGKDFLNIQNQWDVADWPCFSKYYVTFRPEIPPGKIIVSANLTLRQWGHAGEGWPPGPQPSFIQVLAVGEDWDEATITWNNAPLALENLSGTWAEPLEDPGWPGEDRTWDVSRAVAAAYAAQSPVRLALYEADDALHSGKYFYSSDNWYEEGRPTLRITWGHPLGSVEKTATPRSGRQGDPVTYTLRVLGTGQSLTLTDTLPLGLDVPGEFVLQGTNVTPAYDAAHHRLMWSDTPPAEQQVTIRYSATITASTPQALTNVAELRTQGTGVSAATVTVLANPHRLFLPLVGRNDLGGMLAVP